MSDAARSAGPHSSRTAPSTPGGGAAEVCCEGEPDIPVRELGGEAMWTISSAKPGNGVDQLRDGNLATYWQSDGSAPHIVTIQFLRNTSISSLDFYVNFSLDESYTPKRVVVRAGSSVHDLVDVASADVPQEPEPPSSPEPEEGGGGRWVRIPLASQDADRPPGPLRAHVLQLRIISMHQSGKDTHIRQVRVFGPRGLGLLPPGTVVSAHLLPRPSSSSLRPGAPSLAAAAAVPAAAAPLPMWTMAMSTQFSAVR